MSKLGVTTTELQNGLSPSDTKALTNRLHSWLVHGCGLDVDTMQCSKHIPNCNPVNEEIKREIRAEQQKIGVHISDIKFFEEKIENNDIIQTDLEHYRKAKAERKQRGCSWSSTEID